MEILPTTRRTAQLAIAPQPKWAVAIRQQFGELPAFYSRFSPKVQKYCAKNMAKAVEDNLPTFGQIVKAYGEDALSALIATHMTDAILKMGEDRDVDPYDIRFIADAICGSERFRLLRFPTVLGFFHLLKSGEFDIYGKVTPRKILEAFRKYAVGAEEQEGRITYQLQCRKEAAARAAALAGRMEWEEYAGRHGIADASFLDWMRRQEREYKLRRDFFRIVGEVIKTIADALSFIADWQKRENKGRISSVNDPNFDGSAKDGQFTIPRHKTPSE